MADELYVTIDEKGNTFKCVKSQLQKTGGVCPIHGHMVYPEMATAFEAQKKAKIAKVEAELTKLKGSA